MARPAAAAALTMTATARQGDATRAIRWAALWPIFLWALLTAGTLVARPPMSLAESSGLSIAWDMRLAGSWLPRLNGQPLAEEPPLLYWLIEAAWSLFGVSEAAARLIAPLFALGSLLVIGPVARLLWPDRRQIADFAAIALAGSAGFAAYCGTSMTALPLMFFATVGLLGVTAVWRGRSTCGWVTLGLALGLGFLASGAMALACLAPTALAAPLWQRHPPDTGWGRWYAGLAGALGIAGAIALLWLGPAAATGGLELLARIAGGGRSGASPAHPWYWPAAALLVFLYPWILWRTLWRALRRQRRRFLDPALRLCLAAAAAALFAAWLAEGRQTAAALPALPPLALITARLVVAHGGKVRDFHAVIPALMALIAGGVSFLLNIIPVAHLDALWREFVSERSLPIWFGGSSVFPGLLLLVGSFVLAQMTPRELVSRGRQLALLPLLLVTAFNLEFLVSLRPFFDLTPIAQKLHELQEAGRPIAFRGHYRGEFNFSGRIEEPLAVIDDSPAALAWAAANPGGVIVAYFEGSLLRLPERPLYLGPAADSWAALWPAEAVARTRGAVLLPRF